MNINESYFIISFEQVFMFWNVLPLICDSYFFLKKIMLRISILCDVNRNVNINNHEDIFGILNTPTK